MILITITITIEITITFFYNKVRRLYLLLQMNCLNVHEVQLHIYSLTQWSHFLMRFYLYYLSHIRQKYHADYNLLMVWK